MRLHRFYNPEPVGNLPETTIKSMELVNQLRRVFRLKAGDLIVAYDGSGSDHKAAISRFIGDDGVVLEHRETVPSRFMPSRKVKLFAAVIKKDNFETIVQKATELGVTDVVPVLAEHSEKKGLNMERLRKISIEASEQSGRGDVPTIHPITDLKSSVDSINGKSIAFHTEGEPFNGEEFKKDEPISIFIGPEGGWSPEEIDMFHKAKIQIVCLGPQVLRAETAVVAALSVVMLNG